jgi:hypothetical protein
VARRLADAGFPHRVSEVATDPWSWTA